MKVFISWSGVKSKAVAEALHQWLPLVIQSIEPWMSAHDIHKGTRWGAELTDVLSQCNFGILCLTPDNLEAPWLIFEAGALSKVVDRSRVVPYLLDVDFSDIEGPLEQFNGAKAEKEETRKLLHAIMAIIGDSALSEAQFNKLFETFWPELEQRLRGVTSKSQESATKSESVSGQTEKDGDKAQVTEESQSDNKVDSLFIEMLDAHSERNLQKLRDSYARLEGLERDAKDKTRDRAIYLYLCFRLGDAAALGQLQELAKTEDSAGIGDYWIGATFEAAENYTKAIEAYEFAAQKATEAFGRANAQVSAATCRYKIGEKDSAFQVLKNAINTATSAESLPILFAGLASLYKLNNEYALRAICLEKALEYKPNDTVLRFDTAYAYSSEQAQVSALCLLHYRTLLHFAPDHPSGWNNIGVEYNQHELRGRSVKAYKKAAELKNTLAASNLAHLYINGGFYEEATNILKQAQEQPDVHKDVGSAYTRIIESQEKETEKLEQVLAAAREQQRFLLSFGQAFFMGKGVGITFAGKWKDADGVVYTIAQSGAQIEGEWTKVYTEYKLKGESGGLGAYFRLLEKGYSSFSESGHGYMYLSSDGSKLFIMTVKGRTHTLLTLDATSAEPDEGETDQD